MPSKAPPSFRRASFHQRHYASQESLKVRGEKGASLREDGERKKDPSHRHWVRGGPETNCMEVMPWVASEKCLKSRQRGVQSWQRLGAPHAEWEGRDSEQKQTTGARMTFPCLKITRHVVSRYDQRLRVMQVNRNQTKGSHSTELQAQAARTPTVTWMIPSGPRFLLLSSCSFKWRGEVPCSRAPTSLGHTLSLPHSRQEALFEVPSKPPLTLTSELCHVSPASKESGKGRVFSSALGCPE